MISLKSHRLVFLGVLVVLGMASPAWSCGDMIFPSSLLCSSPSLGGTLGYPSLRITLVMPARASWGYDKPISYPPQLTPRSSTPAPSTYPSYFYPAYGTGSGSYPYGMGAWNPYAYSSPMQWMPSGYSGAPSLCGGSALSGGSLFGGGGVLGCGSGYGTVLPYGNFSGSGTSSCSSCGSGNGGFGWGGGSNYIIPSYTLVPSYAGMGSSCGALTHQCSGGGGGMGVVNPRPVCVIASCSPRYLLRPVLRAKTERSRRFY